MKTRRSRRVAVTGIGMVTPIGVGVEHNWSQLIDARSGISKIEKFDVSNVPCKIAGFVPRGKRSDNFYDPGEWFNIKERRKLSDFVAFARVAAREAITDSGWVAKNHDDENRAGVMIGSGIGGLEGIFEGFKILETRGVKRLSPFFIPANIINSASGNIAIEFGLRGPNHAVSTACASGTHAIGDASRLIAHGDADMMIAGGAESSVTSYGLSGFAAMKALSTHYNDRPEEASRPWDKERDGFVMGEGAGILILEEMQQAKKRQAKIYAEVKGYGLSGDAYNMVAPRPDSAGAILAMKSALNDSMLDPASIGYINAHGTSTPIGDDFELHAVETLFGAYAKNIMMSSTKSAIGHLLGAAGAVEAIYSIMAMNRGVAPPTLNLHSPSESSVVDRVPLTSKPLKTKAVMSNSFGFGGTNASIVLSAV